MTHDTNDAGGGAVADAMRAPLGEPFAIVNAADFDTVRTERDRLRAFVASLKAKAQQSIIILPRHFEAFEKGTT